MPDDFTITVTESAVRRVDVTVAGELDLVTAPPLTEALDSVVRDETTVVVNMAAVTFVDSTALHTLFETDLALRANGGRLFLTAPSPVVRRLLELSGMSDHFTEPAAAAGAAAGGAASEPLEQRLSEIMTELAGIVLTASSLHDDLEQLIRFSCQVLPGCDAGSIALLVDGKPTTVAISEHVALELDIAQYDNDEGPSLTALDGERIRVDIVEADERFPHFAAAAADHRVHSILSMPIIHHDAVVGTLNLYSHEPEAFDATSEHIARVASGQAAHAITRSHVLTAVRQRRDQLQARYDEHVLVARAQGVLIATQHCSAEQACNLIDHAAAATSDTLLTIAQRILDTARDSNAPG